jgi:tetratricopeptide (TPR) repeat protein
MTRLLATSVALLCCARGAAQPAPIRPPTAQEYRAFVESYRRNGAAEIERALTVRREDLDRVVDAAIASGSTWEWHELRAAAMLHSEAAFHAARARDSDAAAFHIDLAQRLLDRTVNRARVQEDFAWRWYTVVPRLLDTAGERGLRKRLDAYAEQRWSYDTMRAKYLRGLDFEATGARSGQIMKSTDAAVDQAVWLLPAASAYAETLKGNPVWRAAAVHLGRLRMLQGERDEAAGLFRSALDDADPAMGYLAALFLGSLEERVQRFDAAETLYRRAIARHPFGQSGPLALAEVLSRTGREAEARAVLAAGPLRSRAAIVEPLWTFSSSLDHELGTRFDLLRMEVWK